MGKGMNYYSSELKLSVLQREEGEIIFCNEKAASHSM